MKRGVAKPALMLSILMTAFSFAQERLPVRSSIVYIAGQTVYIGAGRLLHLEPGDSASVTRQDVRIGTLVITAVADSSGAAKIVSQTEKLRVGDDVTAYVTPAANRTAVPALTSSGNGAGAPESLPAARAPAPVNVVSGRFALQYTFVGAEETALNLSQPAAVLQMSVGNFLDAGMTLRVYGVSFLNGNGAYALYGNRGGLQNNLYQVYLTGELPGASLGYGIGRLSSGYVSGLGTFDGGELRFRVGHFTVGAIGGGVPSVPASTLGYLGTKTAAFVNYEAGPDYSHRYSGTAAYALRLVNGRLDRNYLYLQNSLGLGSKLYFYESTELDLSTPSNGIRRPGLSFSNTFFSMNYFPAEWLFANVGYDAYRVPFLFQTMKSLPDSLIDRNISQDIRGSVSFYLPGSITVSANASYGTSRDYARNRHTLGASVRGSDLLGLGLGGSVRYMNIVGSYSNANDMTIELDRTFFDALDFTARYEYYDMAVSILQQTYVTQTITGYIDYYFSGRWYTTIELDDVIDPSMNSIRVFAELGIRF